MKNKLMNIKLGANTRTRLLQGLGIVGLFSMIIFVFVFSQSGGDRNIRNIEREQTSISRIEGVEAEDIWLQTAEGRIRELEENIEIVTSLNNELRERNQALLDEKATILKDTKQLIDTYEDVLGGFEGDINNLINDGLKDIAGDALASSQNRQPSGDPFSSNPIDPQPQSSAAAGPTTSFVRFTLQGSNNKTSFDEVASRSIEIGGKDSEHYLAAGSYAPAIIIAGAAAPVGVAAQNNPRPVVLRVTGPATSASNTGGFTHETDITGCTITGSSVGDLSSERVYIRLIKMVCDWNGELIETDVKGFVAGTGQAGVRGPVISREGDLISRSFAAGVVGGFGDAASASLAPPLILNSEGASQTDQALIADAGRAGIAEGIGTAGGALADYYIERAEQYQPVISLKGGTSVEVVFLEGNYIDGRKEIQSEAGE